MEVTVKAPATCGEFLQGIWRNQPCLISAPIDIYSTVCLKEGFQIQNLGEKSKYLIHLFSNRFGINQELINKVEISINSPIPKSVGMGSSTADLSALLKALCTYFFVDLDDEEIGRILTKVEPTDNAYLSNLTLFNHYTGKILYSFNKCINSDILIGYSENDKLDTLDFSYQKEFLRDESNFQKILETFSQGLQNSDLNLIGKACTNSAKLNQSCLFKDYLEKALWLAEECASPGIIIGHTGSVVGFLIDRETKTEEIKTNMINFNSSFKFIKSKLVKGGLKVKIEF